ncbi:uncharacterized protein LOC125873729 [Solanum stenotomum]|uniref:uncharacterized protein LOC125873729 n=1 Tax=Solanum stenotomum TaxID=172797 RepID=UPI0020D089B8|nr:uncharacterized protein LOC125873729 [Solanum stenotomum]
MRLNKDSQPVTEYLQSVRSIADELSIVGTPITNSELIVKILSGLGTEFHGISAAICARDSPITYEELYEKLQDHELFLRREESKSFPIQITAGAATSNQSGNSSYRNNHRPNNNNGSNQQWRSNSRFTLPNQRRSSTNNNSYDGVRCQLCNKLSHVANVCCISFPYPTHSAAPPDHIDPPLPQSLAFPIVYSRRNKTMSFASRNSAAHPTASILLQPSLEPVPVTEPPQPSLPPLTRVVTRS